MPAVGLRPPCCRFIHCSIPAAARLISPAPSRIFYLTPPFRSYAFWQLSFSWFIPFMNVYPIYGPIYYFPAKLPLCPSPVPPTIHSLSWFIGIHFSRSLFPLYCSSSCSATLLPPLLPSTKETFFVVSTAFLFGQWEFFFLIGSLPYELNGNQLRISWPIDSIPWILICA